VPADFKLTNYHPFFDLHSHQQQFNGATVVGFALKDGEKL
jgi:hypothetical protein